MDASALEIERLELRTQATPAAVPGVRRAVVDFAELHGVGVPPDVALAVSEAITNAVLHAYREEQAGHGVDVGIALVVVERPEAVVRRGVEHREAPLGGRGADAEAVGAVAAAAGHEHHDERRGPRSRAGRHAQVAAVDLAGPGLRAGRGRGRIGLRGRWVGRRGALRAGAAAGHRQ